MTMPVNEWVTVQELAERVGRQPRAIWRWLAVDPGVTGIRRKQDGGRTLVHLPTALAHHATVRIGRPRKTTQN